MYTKIASALLISAALMTPIAALAAGGNIAKAVDGKLCIKTSDGPNRVAVTGTLDLATGEIATEIWTWVYQQGGARQIYYKTGTIYPVKMNFPWEATEEDYKDDEFAPGTASVVAIMYYTKNASPMSYVWYRDVELVTSGPPC